MFHVCTSNGLGFCMACRSEGASLASPVAGNVSALRATLAFLVERSRLSKVAQGLAADAAGMGLATAAKALTGLVSPLATCHDASTLRSLSARMDRNRSEIERTAEGRARRAAKASAKAAKAKAAGIAAQASLIALRVSQDATYRVWIKFARGAHAVQIATEAPKGFREARASIKVRGEAPGLRYGAAERIRDGIQRKLAPARRHG